MVNSQAPEFIGLYVLLSAHPLRVGQRTLANLDRHSMGIYIIHHLLIWSVLLFLPGATALMDTHFVAAPLGMFISVLAVSWLLTALLSKNAYTNFLFNARLSPTSK